MPAYRQISYNSDVTKEKNDTDSYLGTLSRPTVHKRKNTQNRDKLSHPRPYPELDEIRTLLVYMEVMKRLVDENALSTEDNAKEIGPSVLERGEHVSCIRL